MGSAMSGSAANHEVVAAALILMTTLTGAGCGIAMSFSLMSARQKALLTRWASTRLVSTCAARNADSAAQSTKAAADPGGRRSLPFVRHCRRTPSRIDRQLADLRHLPVRLQRDRRLGPIYTAQNPVNTAFGKQGRTPHPTLGLRPAPIRPF